MHRSPPQTCTNVHALDAQVDWPTTAAMGRRRLRCLHCFVPTAPRRLCTYECRVPVSLPLPPPVPMHPVLCPPPPPFPRIHASMYPEACVHVSIPSTLGPWPTTAPMPSAASCRVTSSSVSSVSTRFKIPTHKHFASQSADSRLAPNWPTT